MPQQGKHLEIERRWLLSGPPNFTTLKILHDDWADITTVYILADPELEVRIRRRQDLSGRIKFTVVMKIGRGLIRQETPKLLANEELFNYYFGPFKSSHIPHILEEYWKIQLQIGKELEIKRLKGPGDLKGLVLAEIEFKSEDVAKQFSEKDFPLWLKSLIVKEVTDDPRYNGKNLAVRGRPNPA
ncbi:MAG: hypothetical protein HYT65_01050 [Candidatus Yanofskybacteria bacterium]|nr:hypothetical protein [Candidatus Yanofskybacteria bacterium]